MGSPAKLIRELTEQEILMIKMSAESYVHNGKRFMSSLTPV